MKKLNLLPKGDAMELPNGDGKTFSDGWDGKTFSDGWDGY